MFQLEVKYKERIDKYISDNSHITRNDAQELIKQEAVYLDDHVYVRKANYLPKIGSIITVEKLIEKETDIKPLDLPIDIVYSDKDIVIVNKPSGLVVHPAPGHLNDTLVNILMHHFKNDLSNTNGLLRLGIVHRIDKDTSGLLIVAKNNVVHNKLAEIFKKHQAKRSYIAICEGVLENKITKINLPIKRNEADRRLMSVHKDGKEAITYVHLLKTFYIDKKPYSLVRCELETGRTHQIRVHLAYIKHPVYGDPVYGKEVDNYNQRLHAYKLDFMHPISSEKIEVFAPIPKEFNIADYDFDQLKKI
ncbi:RluA family pseudouridine synthase [Mycoplasma tauri]|uniref:RluA family pseudouridine synthase n=1 Tax=Mycoplasma tauri TaxID=547987 RepID=UPI001CBF28CE|nr:RluA family pseudouridine synthase [Mycoplasma tauri]MBZ4204230.1 RluA family pseudouridine synthase [Mycoplasma tauri]